MTKIILPATLILFFLATTPGAIDKTREQAIQIVSRIQRADYEGDRGELKRLSGELAPYLEDKDLNAKVHYWRGFALWRRAINGGNEKVPPREMEEDFKQAVVEFEAALAKDPAFVDARSAAGSTLGNLMALYVRNPDLSPDFKEPAQRQPSIDKAMAYMNDAQAADPENPRVWWVLGPVRYYLSFQRKEGPDKASDAALEMYQKGLEAARKREYPNNDPLTPAWGEAECLMSLAAVNFYRPTPDLAAAEEHARSALKLVPHWHYVRDILLKQIAEAKAKQAKQTP